MASLETRNGRTSLVFWWQGKKTRTSLGKVSDLQAEQIKAAAERTIGDMERGRLEVPDNVDLALFVLSDGRQGKIEDRPPELTLHAMLDAMLADTPKSSWAETSWTTLELHVGHLRRLLPDVPLAAVNRALLQKYIGKRIQDDTNPEGPTIRKEIETLRSIWNRYSDLKFVPMKSLDLPKTKGKPPFQTWEQCEESGEWDSLFLNPVQTADFLAYMKGRGPDWLYPMLTLAAHTGARRSELGRALLSDFHFDRQTWDVRERKKDKSKEFTIRTVDLSTTAMIVLQDWLKVRPKGPTFFGVGPLIRASRALTTWAKDKWQPCGKWHMLRHSFASNLAAANVDQRIIDSYLGHQTEEMRARYRHLFPSTRRAALTAVYA